MTSLSEKKDFGSMVYPIVAKAGGLPSQGAKGAAV